MFWRRTVVGGGSAMLDSDVEQIAMIVCTAKAVKRSVTAITLSDARWINDWTMRAQEPQRQRIGDRHALYHDRDRQQSAEDSQARSAL